MGFYGSQGPSILPGDNRAALTARAIGDLTNTIQQRRNDSEAADDNSAKVKAAGLVALVQKFNLTPEQYAEVRQKAVAFDPKVDQYLPAMPSYTPSAEDNFRRKVLDKSSSTFDTLPQGALQQGTYQTAYGAAMPQDTVKLTNQQDVTGNKDRWTPEVQQDAAIEGGRAMNADQTTVTGETHRHNVTEEGQTGAVRSAQVNNINSEIPLHQAQTEEANAKAKTAGGAAIDPVSAVDALTRRTASLDDFAKKGTPERQRLINSMPPGIIAPNNEKERSDLVGANNIASLMQDRIKKLRELGPVVDSRGNRVAIASLLNASDGAFGNMVKSEMRNHVDKNTLEYITELRNLREDLFGLRKYLANSPVRSDKQVALMLAQVPGAEIANSADLNRVLDAYEPAVQKLIIGTQGGGRPVGAGGGAGGAGGRMSKTQTNTATGEKRTVYSDDGGATWHP